MKATRAGPSDDSEFPVKREPDLPPEIRHSNKDTRSRIATSPLPKHRAASTARSGERRPILTDEERDALYRDFQPLVRRLIARYGGEVEIRQDLTGEIYCRFCQLVSAYEPERGVPIKAYLVRTLTASVYSYARSRWREE